MPAVKRFDAKFTLNIAREQLAWLQQQAATRKQSAADVIRDLIDPKMRRKPCRRCPNHCPHEEVQQP